jgi:holliday junction DNA helicase RuvB
MTIMRTGTAIEFVENNFNIVGHDATKKLIMVASAAAKARNEALPHMLFSGLAGTGKTTFAMGVAKVANVGFLPVSPDDMTSMESVLATLDKISNDGYNRYGDRLGKDRPIYPTIIFFDEIHRMPRKGQEILGIAMEKFQVESGKPNKFFWIPYFTIIGATTDDGELTKPFREKFKLRFIFETYEFVDMVKIINFHARQKGIDITPKAARLIAERSRGVPRLAVNYLERGRDYAHSISAGVVTTANVSSAFDQMKIDSKGLSPTEMKILKILYSAREPIGLDNLSIITNESQKNIKNTVEPYLIQQGLILRAGRGRVITDAGRKHLESYGFEGRIIDKAEIEAGYVRS